ncbi:hypothetical protein [Emcibacter sp.]|uniref:hypothetical protein n=1 Tax=Emcibacter sp. TaxID=1979954 RepID=UPI002AA6F550|nr:hypothetical protein [Emcibacter sp.]
MFVGHYGAGLALKKYKPGINLGWLFLAVMLPDILLGVFVLFGVEKITVPENYSALHYLTFDFPYSHGLLASLLWALFAFLFVRLLKIGKADNKMIAWLMALAVFSHFLLDVLVHIPEMPLLGNSSVHLGLGLWKNLPLSLGLEVLVALAGLGLYLAATPKPSARQKFGVPALVFLMICFTVGGQLFSPAPENTVGPAVSWIMSGVLIALVAGVLDRKTLNPGSDRFK